MQQTMMMLEMRRQGMLICFISGAMSPRLNMSLSGWLSWWGDGDGVELECVKVVFRCVVISTSSSWSSLIVLFMIELLKNCAFISKHYINKLKIWKLRNQNTKIILGSNMRSDIFWEYWMWNISYQKHLEPLRFV